MIGRSFRARYYAGEQAIMSIGRRALSVVSAGIFAFAVGGASRPAVAGGQQKNERKLDKAQQEEAKALTQMLDRAQAGSAVSADIPVSVDTYHYFKSATGTDYVPFVVGIDTAKLPNTAVSVMLRVVQNQGDTPTVQAESGKPAPLSPATFQDLYFVDVRPAVAGKPGILARAFQAPAGSYDVYIAVKERTPADKKTVQTGVCKRTVSLPNLGGELTLSSVLVASKVDELKAPYAGDQQFEHPYALGVNEFTPQAGTKFATTDRLRVFFQIYNYTLVAGNKPNVLVEYNFYQKLEGGEKFAKKTDPVVLDANNQHPMFDGTKHPLEEGREVPLQNFAVGDYRLEIKVTDRPSGKSVTRNLEFSVVTSS